MLSLCYWIPSLVYWYWTFCLFVLWRLLCSPFVIAHRLWLIDVLYVLLHHLCRYSLCYWILPLVLVLYVKYHDYYVTPPPHPPPRFFVVACFCPLAAAVIVPFLLPLLYVVIKKKKKKKKKKLSLVHCSFVLWPPLGSPSVWDRLWFIDIDFSFFFGMVTTTPLLLNTVSGSLLLIFLSSLVLWQPPLCYWIPSLVYLYWFFLSSLVLWPPPLCYWILSLVYYYWFFFLLWYCDHHSFVIEYRLKGRLSQYQRRQKNQ